MALFLSVSPSNRSLLTHPTAGGLITLVEQVPIDATVMGDYFLPLPTGQKIKVHSQAFSDTQCYIDLDADFDLIYVYKSVANELGTYDIDSAHLISYAELSDINGSVFTIYNVKRDSDATLKSYLQQGNYTSAAAYLAIKYTPVAKLKLASNKWTIQTGSGTNWYGFTQYNSYSF